MGLLMLIIRHRILKEKSIKVFALACATNFIMLSAAENLGYVNTGFIASLMAVVASVLLGPVALQQLAKRNPGKDYGTARTKELKDGGQVYEPLHISNKYQDLRVPLTDVLFIFSAQTTLFVLYMQDLWAPLPFPSFYSYFNVGLWACGWVAQGIAYSKFGFHLTDEIQYWKKLTRMSAVAIKYGDRVSGLPIADTEKSFYADVDWRLAAFRGSLSFIVHAVYHIYLWMTLPLYIARGFGGVQLLTHVVAMVYVMILADLSRPAFLRERVEGDIESGEDNETREPRFHRNPGMLEEGIIRSSTQ
jgi:hypothetical protein